MTGARPADILRQLDGSGPPDAELLACYSRQRDQAAFAELVRRHGPLVWGACRRVAGHTQDAEDAFQAAFLILSRKANAIREPGLLGNWLYGVAVRVGLKARRSAARRRAREVQVSVMPDPPDTREQTPPGSPEFAPVLDEELAALPACYREAIVLCDLRGVSREEAARVLGVPEGTLSSRLANGRKKLASRLTKRGITLAVAAIPGVLTSGARAAVPPELLAKTCGIPNSAIPTAVSRLASGDFTMTTKWLFGALGTAAMVASAVYAARDDGPPQQAEPPKPGAAAKGEAAPEQKPDPKPGDKMTFTTKPRLVKTYDIDFRGDSTAVWNSEGTLLAIAGIATGPDPNSERATIYVFSMDGTGGSTMHPMKKEQIVGFTTSGKGLVTTLREYELASGRHRLYFLEPDSPKKGEMTYQKLKRTVDLDDTETHGYAFAPDGKTFRTLVAERDAAGVPTKLEVLEVDATTGKTLKSLLKVDYGDHTLSPDGKRLAVAHPQEDVQVKEPKEPGKKREIAPKGPNVVQIYDLDRGAKLVSARLPAPPALRVAGPGGPIPPRKSGASDRPGGLVPSDSERSAVVMSFSPDHRRLVVSRDVGQTVVFSAETGEALPALEGTDRIRTVPGPHAFTGDGRLLALFGRRYMPRDEFSQVGGQPLLFQGGDFVGVWDTQTGKVLKSWDRPAKVAFNPARPLLAMLERNGAEMRLGLWDFAAELGKK